LEAIPVRAVTDAQVRKLMGEMTKRGPIGDAAMKAGMHRQTARKYVEAGDLPSTMAAPRDWRTRSDPFEEHWPDIEARLRATPGLEAKTLFELLEEAHPSCAGPTAARHDQIAVARRHLRSHRVGRHVPEVAR
jgi:hypothetical protein